MSRTKGFTMLDVSQTIFLLITRPPDWCYACGRSCRKSTRPTAVSNTSTPASQIPSFLSAPVLICSKLYQAKSTLNGVLGTSEKVVNCTVILCRASYLVWWLQGILDSFRIRLRWFWVEVLVRSTWPLNRLLSLESWWCICHDERRFEGWYKLTSAPIVRPHISVSKSHVSSILFSGYQIIVKVTILYF